MTYPVTMISFDNDIFDNYPYSTDDLGDHMP